MNPAALAGSQFSPEAFLDATMDTPLERRQPLPVENPERPDGFYPAMVKDVKVRTWESKNPDAKKKAGIAWDVICTITIPMAFQESLKLPAELTMTDGIMLDTTDAGLIDGSPGANRRLRAWREALNMNQAGQKFSGRMMIGQPVLIKVRHEEYQGDIQDKIDRPVRFT